MMMQISLRYVEGMHLVGANVAGVQTSFDASPDHGGNGNGASPMEVFLQSMVGCTTMDVLEILRKKRKTIVALQIYAEAERAEQHPKVFTAVRLRFVLTSPDAELKDLERSVELSQTTYCSAAAMFRNAGCAISWECEVLRPE